MKKSDLTYLDPNQTNLKASLLMLDVNCGITYPRKPNMQLQKQDLRNLSKAIAKSSVIDSKPNVCTIVNNHQGSQEY